MIRLLRRPAATTTAFKYAAINSGTTRVCDSWSRLPVIGLKKDIQQRTMSATKATAASPYHIHITPENTGLLKVTQTKEAADTASNLLQEDLKTHHVFFNDDGYHNHIPHQILALYGTGAPSPSLQQGYNTNTVYQRPAKPPHKDVLTSLIQSWDHDAPSYLGKEAHYPDFLAFFQSELSNAGPSWEETILTKYLFKPKGDPAGDDMLVRLYSGFLHPLIQLMYGVEWEQPAIVAEGLAQAAVHGNDIGGFLLECERRGEENGEEMGEILGLYEAVGRDETLRGAVRMGDANKVRDGVLVRAREEMIEIARRVRVRAEEGEVERRTAEMFDACVYVAGAAAVKGGKVPKFDFFLIHHVNASPFFLSMNSRSWLPIETKARLLEWKIRMDLIQYAARAVPTLSVDKITGYKPKRIQQSVPSEIISRLHTLQDDGHAIKLGRAALICHDLVTSLNKENKLDGVKLAINTDELWNNIFHLVADSFEAPGPHTIRVAGLEEAWADVPDAESDSGESHKL